MTSGREFVERGDRQHAVRLAPHSHGRDRSSRAHVRSKEISDDLCARLGQCKEVLERRSNCDLPQRRLHGRSHLGLETVWFVRNRGGGT